MAITRHFRAYFVRGLAVLLPTILTIWIFVWGYRFISENISTPINHGLVKIIILSGSPTPKEDLVRFWVHGLGSAAGFLLALVVVCLVGMVLASVVGRTLWKILEKFLVTAPVIKSVYPYIKQFTDFLLTQIDHGQKLPFSRVVAVEYPRKGIWSIGLITSQGTRKIPGAGDSEFVTVFIPNSPMPVTGFTVIAAKDQTRNLDMSIEEALRFVASVGVIGPGTPSVPAAASKVFSESAAD